MSAVIAVPELIAGTATDLATIGSTLAAAHITATPATLSVLPAAADEISTGVAHLFSAYAQGYQALAGQAAAFHAQFEQHVTASAHAYVSAEAVNASALQPLTAAAGSVQGQLVNLFDTAVQQIANTLTGFWNSVTPVLFDVIFVLFLLALLVAWAFYVQAGNAIPPGGFPI